MVISIIILAVIIGVIALSAAKKQREEIAAYELDMSIVRLSMLASAAEAEDAGNLIKSVWYNAIYEESDFETDKYTQPYGYFVSDFNIALSNLFADPELQNQISSIESDQSYITDTMKSLVNPPEGYEEAYEAIKELYDAYLSLSNLVISPSGSLTTFSRDFNEMDSEVLDCYKATEIYID